MDVGCIKGRPDGSTSRWLMTGLAAVMAVLSVITPVSGYATGAPTSRCSSMVPGHGSQPSSDPPYTISLGGITSYKSDQPITVSISGTFQGIMMQVRKVGGSTSRYGEWTNVATNTRTMTCSNSGDTVTHANDDNKIDPVFTWMPPDYLTGDIQVIATIAQEKGIWWKDVKSAILTEYVSTTSTTTTTTTTTPPSTMANEIAVTDSTSLVTSLSTSEVSVTPDATEGSSDVSASIQVTGRTSLAVAVCTIVFRLLL